MPLREGSTWGSSMWWFAQLLIKHDSGWRNCFDELLSLQYSQKMLLDLLDDSDTPSFVEFEKTFQCDFKELQEFKCDRMAHATRSLPWRLRSPQASKRRARSLSAEKSKNSKQVPSLNRLRVSFSPKQFNEVRGYGFF